MPVSIPPSHLLMIPREIRDQIYSYLHKTLELRTVSHLGGAPVIFGIINAPYVSVLLTHTRLHDEYKESRVFKNLAGRVANIDDVAGLWDWVDDAKTKLQDHAALVRLKHVFLRFTHPAGPHLRKYVITDFLSALGLVAPCLKTIMIGEFKHLQHFKDDASLPTDLSFPATNSIPQLGPQVLGLNLLQRVDCRWRQSFCDEATPNTIGHCLFQVRMHTYSLKHLAKPTWTPEVLLAGGTPPGYRRLMRKVVYKYAMLLVESRPCLVVGWREEQRTLDS